MHIMGEGASTTAPENVENLAAVRTGKSAHVLNHTQDSGVHALEHTECASHIARRYILRSRDQHGTIEVYCLHQGKMSIARAGWHVYDQEIELSPLDLFEKLPK